MSDLSALELYNRYIRQLPPVERLQLLALLASDLAMAATWREEQSEQEIMALYGVGEGRGIDMDAQEYIGRLREGRSTRPREG